MFKNLCNRRNLRLMFLAQSRRVYQCNRRLVIPAQRHRVYLRNLSNLWAVKRAQRMQALRVRELSDGFFHSVAGEGVADDFLGIVGDVAE